VAKRIANNNLSLPRRLAFTAKFQTEKPVCGPIALGHSCHFGLGLFVPAAPAVTDQ